MWVTSCAKQGSRAPQSLSAAICSTAGAQEDPRQRRACTNRSHLRWVGLLVASHRFSRYQALLFAAFVGKQARQFVGNVVGLRTTIIKHRKKVQPRSLRPHSVMVQRRNVISSVQHMLLSKARHCEHSDACCDHLRSSRLA